MTLFENQPNANDTRTKPKIHSNPGLNLFDRMIDPDHHNQYHNPDHQLFGLHPSSGVLQSFRNSYGNYWVSIITVAPRNS